MLLGASSVRLGGGDGAGCMGGLVLLTAWLAGMFHVERLARLAFCGVVGMASGMGSTWNMEGAGRPVSSVRRYGWGERVVWAPIPGGRSSTWNSGCCLAISC